MVNKKYILLFFIFLFSTLGFTQRLIGYINTNLNTAYVGQPIQITVSVYTSTWFTSGIDIGNIQIEGAFTVYFRSVTSTKAFQGKNHAGVEFIYNIYPNEAGELVIPELTIHVVSPKPDDYKGIPQVIKTKSKIININDVPLGQNPNKWLVTTNLNITENWAKGIDNLKVGDVIKRTISQNVSNTVSEFIPPISWDSIAGVSNYIGRASVQTNKSKTYVSGKRTESIQYLFEEAGEVIIPALEFNYWNPRTKKYHQKTIPEKKIMIAPNDDLDMLLSAKAKLNTESLSTNDENENSQFLIFGLTINAFLKILFSILIALLVFIKLFKYIRNTYQEKHKKYLQSEQKAFNDLLKSIQTKSYAKITNSTLKWLLKLDLTNKSIDCFILKYGTEKLKNEINLLRGIYFSKKSDTSNIDYSALKKELVISRKNYLMANNNSLKMNSKFSSTWLNPVKINIKKLP